MINSELNKFLSQNLFLLSQNEIFIKDIKKLKRKHSKEIRNIKQNRSLLFLAIRLVGLGTFQKDLEKIYTKIPLRFRADQHVLAYFIVGKILDQDTDTLLKGIENKRGELSPLSPSIAVSSSAEKINIKLSLFPYHSKTEVIKFLDSKWHLVQDEITHHTSNIRKFNKPKPLKHFDRDIKIFLDKKAGKTYPQLIDKYDLYHDTIHRIIIKYRQRIRLLYGNK